MAILITIFTLSSSIIWTEKEARTEGTGTPLPTTFEGWLYDYYYNATRLGYDRDDWGGRVIKTDDPMALIDLDPDNLTVPVFVRIPTELTDDYIDLMSAKFFPGVESSLLQVHRYIGVDSIATNVRVVGPNGELELGREKGGISYREDRPSKSAVRLETNESAMRYAIDWLEARGVWPDDIASRSIWRNDNLGSEGGSLYILTMRRSILGFAFDEMVGRLYLFMDAATGRIDNFIYDWPAVTAPFVVTSLPPVSATLERYNLTSAYQSDPMFSISENLTYDEATMIWEMGLDDTAPIYFYLPYRWIGYEPWHYGYYGAIFPEENLYYFGG